MTPINNSDTAWLIVSDYNQDNNLPYEELREDVLNPDINDWESQNRCSQIGGCSSIIFASVGGRGLVGAMGGGVGGNNYTGWFSGNSYSDTGWFVGGMII